MNEWTCQRKSKFWRKIGSEKNPVLKLLKNSTKYNTRSASKETPVQEEMNASVKEPIEFPGQESIETSFQVQIETLVHEKIENQAEETSGNQIPEKIENQVQQTIENQVQDMIATVTFLEETRKKNPIESKLETLAHEISLTKQEDSKDTEKTEKLRGRGRQFLKL